mmetsp:Transcript_31688/g.76723  ORF Transcript_31688/g.76723 Transcript_31688/m.76723 type:complete len:98 (+) Transcript_31688:316-609(+)
MRFLMMVIHGHGHVIPTDILEKMVISQRKVWAFPHHPLLPPPHSLPLSSRHGRSPSNASSQQQRSVPHWKTQIRSNSVSIATSNDDPLGTLVHLSHH